MPKVLRPSEESSVVTTNFDVPRLHQAFHTGHRRRIGAVLSQLDSQGKERVVAYGSRLLAKAEHNYCATRKELLAVVTYILYFRPYLLGHRFQLQTDHSSLQWLYRTKEPEGQIARWLEKLQQFEFEIIHRKGLCHTNADALSRLPCTQCGLAKEQGEEEDVLPVAALQISGLNMEEIRKMQAEKLGNPTFNLH